MNQETASESGGTYCEQSAQQIVYVVMSETSDGVAGMVCATRQRAEDELRAILAEYTTYESSGGCPRHSPAAIEAFIEEARHASINAFREDWYWIDVCPVHA